MRMRSGSVPSRQIHSLDPASRLNDAVTASLDEIVEELHIELVVLNDEYGLRHSAFHRARSAGLRDDISAETLTKGEIDHARPVKNAVIHKP